MYVHDVLINIFTVWHLGKSIFIWFGFNLQTSWLQFFFVQLPYMKSGSTHIFETMLYDTMVGHILWHLILLWPSTKCARCSTEWIFIFLWTCVGGSQAFSHIKVYKLLRMDTLQTATKSMLKFLRDQYWSLLFFIHINDLLLVKTNSINSVAGDSILHSSTWSDYPVSLPELETIRHAQAESLCHDLDIIMDGKSKKFVDFSAFKTQ